MREFPLRVASIQSWLLWHGFRAHHHERASRGAPWTGPRFVVGKGRRNSARTAVRARKHRALVPAVSVAGEKPHARRIAAHEHSEAVVFDLVQPASPSGRLRGWARQAGIAEVGEGYATQQHRP